MNDESPILDGRLNRRQMLISMAGGAAVSTGGCLGLGAGENSEPVTIGGTLTLSGPLSPIGTPLHRGLRLWREEVNEDEGLQGREVILDITDDEGRPDAAREAYESLVESAQLLVTPYGSPMTSAVIDTIEAAEVPCIAHTAGDRQLWSAGREWTVQMLNPIDTFLHSALDAAFQAGARSVSFIYRADAFTPTTIEGATEQARQSGWAVRDSVKYGSDAGREAAMSQILSEPPDLIVGGGFQPGKAGGGFLPDTLALARAYERTEGEAELVCWSIGASFPRFADSLGKQAERVMGVTGWKAYVDYPGNRAFIQRYTDRWDGQPDAHAAQGYATGELFEAAAARAESLDAPSYRDALFDLQTSTVFGRYRVNQRGMQIGKTNAVMQWQNGNPVVVWPERWKSDALVY